MSEARRFTVNHTLTKPPETSEAAQIRKQRQDTAQSVRARRKAIHEQAAADAMGATGEPAEQRQPEQMPKRENLESIEVTLQDGRVVEYGPPKGLSLQDRIVRMFSGRAIEQGGPDPGVAEYRLTKLLLGVRAIDGKHVSCNDLIQRTRLANTLGDDALEFLFYYDREYWPPLTAAELPAVKKNYRTPPISE